MAALADVVNATVEVCKAAPNTLCQLLDTYVKLDFLTHACEFWDYLVEIVVGQYVSPGTIILVLVLFILVNSKLELIKSFATMLKIVIGVGLLILLLYIAVVMA